MRLSGCLLFLCGRLIGTPYLLVDSSWFIYCVLSINIECVLELYKKPLLMTRYHIVADDDQQFIRFIVQKFLPEKCSALKQEVVRLITFIGMW